MARCSFCGKSAEEAGHLVSGPRPDVAICGECLELARQVAAEATDFIGGDLVVTGAGELVTNAPGGDDLLGVIPEAAVAIRRGRVTWVGPESDLPARYRELPGFDCEGRAVLPGFVDAHTHLVFAGQRAAEFGRRLRGESYEAILAGGGGIGATVAATRAAEPDELLRISMERAGRMLAAGTTTVEVKSGYGLEVATEVRLLETALELGRRLPLDVVTTFLGAHAVPPEYRADREGYLRLIEEEILPACAPLAAYCDVFCDRGAFAVDEARRILSAGNRHGLRPRLHANQLGHTGGAELAAEVGAVSADHLDHLTAEQAELLRQAGCVAVLLPAASLSLRAPQAPGRLLWEAGITVALATDCNPGTSYVESMQLVVALACLEMGLTAEEAIWSATRGGALALEDGDKGWVGIGAAGDLVVLDADSYLHVPYRPGANLAWRVIKDGDVVVG